MSNRIIVHADGTAFFFQDGADTAQVKLSDVLVGALTAEFPQLFSADFVSAPAASPAPVAPVVHDPINDPTPGDTGTTTKDG